MFAAALLDAMPAAWPACQRAIDAVEPPTHVRASVEAYSDGVLTGRQFHVAGGEPHVHHDAGSHTHAHDHDHHGHDIPDHDGPDHDGPDHDGHDHVGHHPWRDIRSRLERSALSPRERDHAIGIFTALAKAEASVHGIAVDDVAFHEVGAWDSIVDIVAASAIIAQLPGCVWSVGSLPRGRGLVKSVHGMLPVPAPATVKLLLGYELHDDGEEGERITPTGAAILSYLSPAQEADATPRRLITTGTGFGTRRLKQRSNILRATLYGSKEAGRASGCDTVEVLRCEIDDQTPEDLAVALEIVRADADVLDVCQWPVFGKKGRMAVAVQILVRPEASDRAIGLIHDETTTLGVRRTTSVRATLERSLDVSDGVRVKVATRPSGRTAKAEMSDLEKITTHATRQDARRRAERSVLDDEADDG
ncbi:MAG: LarC family nickel insertion protein [Hyphomicrobiaceae bacterium]